MLHKKCAINCPEIGERRRRGNYFFISTKHHELIIEHTNIKK